MPSCIINLPTILGDDALTLGQRDSCLSGVMNDIGLFWDETDLETLLSMNKDDAAAKLQDIAERYSNDSITVNILPEGILFEAMDERSNRQ